MRRTVLLPLLPMALGLLLGAAASAETPAECRARLASDRPTALERWRGPRSNANRYPVYCENPVYLGLAAELGRLPAVQPPQLEGGAGGSPLGAVPPPPPPPPSRAGP